MAVEQPAYTTIAQRGRFAVRDYPALVVAQVTVPGDQKTAGSRGFRLLAGYIFGGNTRRPGTARRMWLRPRRQKIPMTAPVTQMRDGSVWHVQFIMPRGYTLATLPRPNNSAVKLRALPPARMAVLRFSGRAQPDMVAQKMLDLLARVQKKGLYATGPVSLAQYNPPWMPGFLRRNEVMLPIARSPIAR